jgi:type IV secretion system protein TrbB
MTPTSYRVLSTAKARRSSALESALAPIAAHPGDDRVVEIMLNADGVLWIDKHGKGVLPTEVRLSPADSERMVRLVAAEVFVELNVERPSISAKLPPPWCARLLAAIPPIVDAPVFALRKPAQVVCSLDDYVDKEVIAARQCDALVTAVHILIGRGGTGSGNPSALPDIFYVRVSAALRGRLSGHKILRSPLPSPPAVAPRPRSKSEPKRANEMRP